MTSIQPSENSSIETASSAPPADTHRKKVLFRLTALGIGLLLSLLIAETLVRVFHLEPPRLVSKRQLNHRSNQDQIVYYHCYPDNPHGEFAPVPETSQGDWELKTYTLEPETLPLERISETPWSVEYRHSSKGIRDREYPGPPPADMLRIACVGDSFVFGEGVPLEQTIARQLEAQLGAHYEVINAGQVGANTMDELQILAAVAREAHCHRAIFVFIPNDILLTSQLARRQEYINDLVQIRDQYLEEYQKSSWHGGYLKSMALLTSPFEMKKIKQETIQWYLDSYDPRYNQENLRLLQEMIQTISQIPDCRSVFVIYPLMEGFESAYPLQGIHDKVKSMAEQAGLPVLDLAPAFAGQTTSEMWVHPTDHHPNGTANAIATQALLAWLNKDVPWFLKPDQKSNSESSQ